MSPALEEERLRALRTLEVLDTAPEAEFDAIVEGARHLFGCSMAFVSLLDVNRQWFKARYGLDEAETPRDASICQHTVAANETLVIPDTRADPRFATNAGRLRDRRVLEVELARAIAPWRAAELLAAMAKAGVPGGPINSVDQVLADPQVAAREMLRAMRRDDGTEVTVIAYPSRLSRSPASYRLAPPRLGQDTRAVLAAELGLGEAEIETLRAAGVIATAEPAAQDRQAERTP